MANINHSSSTEPFKKALAENQQRNTSTSAEQNLNIGGNNMTQNFADVVQTTRDSTFIKEGEQVPVDDLIGKEMNILKGSFHEDDDNKWADVLVEVNGKKVCFITGSGPLMNAIKTIEKKELLTAGPIHATLVSKKSKLSGRNYYQFM